MTNLSTLLAGNYTGAQGIQGIQGITGNIPGKAIILPIVFGR